MKMLHVKYLGFDRTLSCVVKLSKVYSVHIVVTGRLKYYENVIIHILVTKLEEVEICVHSETNSSNTTMYFTVYIQIKI